MKKTYEQERKEFICGERGKLLVGGYGVTVHLTALRDGVRIKRRQPKIEQLTLDVNSRHNRTAAVEWAESNVEELARCSPGKVSVPESAIVPHEDGTVTVREIWLFRFKAVLGSVPPEVFGWGRGGVVDHLKRMNGDTRAQLVRVDAAHGVIVAARRLHHTGIVPLDVEVGALTRVVLQNRAMAQIDEGWSPWTAKSYLRRFRTAMREHRREHPQRWGNVPDPTQGMKAFRPYHIWPREVDVGKPVRSSSAGIGG